MKPAPIDRARGALLAVAIGFALAASIVHWFTCEVC